MKESGVRGVVSSGVLAGALRLVLVLGGAGPLPVLGRVHSRRLKRHAGGQRASMQAQFCGRPGHPGRFSLHKCTAQNDTRRGRGSNRGFVRHDVG